MDFKNEDTCKNVTSQLRKKLLSENMTQAVATALRLSILN